MQLLQHRLLVNASMTFEVAENIKRVACLHITNAQALLHQHISPYPIVYRCVAGSADIRVPHRPLVRGFSSRIFTHDRHRKAAMELIKYVVRGQRRVFK